MTSQVDGEMAGGETAASDESAATLSPASAISRGLVALTKELTGRGPVKSRTVIKDDVVVCLLGQSLTRAEKTLIDAGQSEHVSETRSYVQGAFERRAIEIVEEALGRRVMSFMSDHDLDNDIAAEVFVLVPAGDGSMAGGD